MNQGPQGLWIHLKDPTDEAEGYSLQQELEKARETSYFSNELINQSVNQACRQWVSNVVQIKIIMTHIIEMTWSVKTNQTESTLVFLFECLQ